jgi:hypothetical protein
MAGCRRETAGTVEKSMIAFLVPLAFAAPFPCGTIDRLPHGPPALAADPLAPPGGELLVRDPFGTDYDDFEMSEHFILKWGSDADPSRNQITGTLDALEHAWTLALEDMGFDRPSFTNEFRLNVYIGDSGGDAPDVSGNVAAYVTLDHEGYAYVVINPETLQYFDYVGYEPYATAVLEHEFLHVVQFGASAYYSQEGRWYWEASADWFSDYAVPEAGQAAQNAVYFLLLPELPLDYFDPGNLSTVANIHQYSSSVFLIATTELSDGDWTPFRDSWIDVNGSDVPIEVLDALLPTGMAATYTEFVRAMTLYELSFGETVEDWLENYGGDFDENHAVTASADSAGSDTPVEIDPKLHPGAFAFNVIEMRHPEPGSVVVTFVADPTGSRSTPSSFDVWVIAGDAITPIPLAKGSGTVEIPETSALSELRVVVVSHPGDAREDETFPYALTLAEGEPPPVDTGVPENEWTPPGELEEEDPIGCNCGSTSRGAGGSLAIAALAIALCRRRNGG